MKPAGAGCKRVGNEIRGVEMRTTRFRLPLLLTVFFNLGISIGARGQTDDLVKEESKRLYSQVPDAEITLPDLSKRRLSDLWRDKPVLITFFFKECTGTCNPFLRSLKAAVEKAGGLNEDYRIVSLSFDPKDKPSDAGLMADSVGAAQNDGWLFGTIAPDDIQRITDAIGFWYKLEPGTGQFDHPSSVTAVRDGKVVRVLLGTNVDPSRLKEVLFELKGVFVPFYSKPGENILFRCFQLDENSQSVGFSWGMLVLLIPGMLALVIARLIFIK
jgi:cytochrome oxidase Cu insertion factor (SCO1/SenC/PrrC family)